MKKSKGQLAFEETNNELLKDPQAAAMYLEEILAAGDLDLFKEAMKDVLSAQNGSMTKASKKTKLSRESLYRSFSRKGNPRFNTITDALEISGLRLSITMA